MGAPAAAAALRTLVIFGEFLRRGGPPRGGGDRGLLYCETEEDNNICDCGLPTNTPVPLDNVSTRRLQLFDLCEAPSILFMMVFFPLGVEAPAVYVLNYSLEICAFGFAVYLFQNQMPEDIGWSYSTS